MTAVADQVVAGLGAGLTEGQAREIFGQGEEAVVFALLELAKMLAERQAVEADTSHQCPATPSGMKPPFVKPTTSRRKKKPGRKAGQAAAARRARDASGRGLSAVRWSVVPRRRDTDALHRRHSPSAASSHRAHDPSRLVPGVRQESRADPHHGVAGLDVGQPHAGTDRLAALRVGQHAVADRRGVQLSSADESHARRPDADVAAGWRGSCPHGTNRFTRRRSTRPCCTATKAAGGSTAKRTGYGVSPTSGSVTS